MFHPFTIVPTPTSYYLADPEPATSVFLKYPKVEKWGTTRSEEYSPEQSCFCGDDTFSGVRYIHSGIHLIQNAALATSRLYDGGWLFLYPKLRLLRYKHNSTSLNRGVTPSTNTKLFSPRRGYTSLKRCDTARTHQKLREMTIREAQCVKTILPSRPRIFPEKQMEI